MSRSRQRDREFVGKEWLTYLFGMFKTRGFCLESTHFTDTKRLNKLVALMTLALCWAVKTGQWLHQHHPIQVKKHGRQAKSIFRYGLDYLQRRKKLGGIQKKV